MFCWVFCPLLVIDTGWYNSLCVTCDTLSGGSIPYINTKTRSLIIMSLSVNGFANNCSVPLSRDEDRTMNIFVSKPNISPATQAVLYLSIFARDNTIQLNVSSTFIASHSGNLDYKSCRRQLRHTRKPVLNSDEIDIDNIG